MLLVVWFGLILFAQNGKYVLVIDSIIMYKIEDRKYADTELRNRIIFLL